MHTKSSLFNRNSPASDPRQLEFQGDLSRECLWLQGLGLCAGGLAALISNPIEVSLVRMQADGRLPVAQQRGYSSVFNALFRIGKHTPQSTAA